ncbi:MAG: tRNA uridine-5-carboxymethylaminomethyl(34) synthesis GTPase MnmE [Eubacteriales bacterium]
MNSTDTIAAISTPHGRGGIAVIRISGDNALAVASAMFRPKNRSALTDIKPNTAVYGGIFHRGIQIDDGIATVFRAPHSFTGEDTVEISCHGGLLLAQMTLEAALIGGACQADAGEFTRRAFTSGKIDLSRAEAVIGLIEAESTEKIKLNAAQSRGVLSRKINSIRAALLEAASSIYAFIDFPDEDMTDLSPSELRLRLEDIAAEMQTLVSTYRAGRAIAEGIPTVIAGKPNTGKSSLLNLLLGEDRAIVSPVAGTTRDTVEETAVAGRVLLRLCDTAGIHNTEDEVERLGIGRAELKLDSAALILAVFDGSEIPDEQDEAFLNTLLSKNGEIIAVINKADLPRHDDIARINARFKHTVSMSCVSGEGMEELIAEIERLFIGGDIDYDNSAVITNARQYAALCSACECVLNAVTVLGSGMTQDIAGLDIEAALAKLGEIDGRVVADEIVDNIFHRFCVGK